MREARDLFAALRKLGVWKRGGQRAPHKPLLLLLVLGRLQRGEPRLVDFNDIEGTLRSLLERFGPPRQSHHPEYPFWWLQSDGLWEIPRGEDLPKRSGSKEPLVTVVRERHVQGGLPEALDSELRDNPDLVRRAAEELLVAHFAPSLHADICDAVGLDLTEMVTSKRRRRDPAFAEMVMRAYEHRCAMCGFRANLDGAAIAIEAAHLRWHASGGPSTVDNGLALCPIHHKLLDLGAFGLDEERRILVSSRLVDLDTKVEVLSRLAGRELIGPQRGTAPVADVFIRWHTREVFRGPPKKAG